MAGISVPAMGTTESFATAPLATSWSTLSVTGGSGDVTSDPTMDAKIGTVTSPNAAGITAAAVNAALGQVGTTGNTGFGPAQYHTASQNAFTFPTGNAATLLMATLTNDTGDTITGMSVTYDFGIRLATGDSAANTTSESIAGHRVYYSTTGLLNSWTPVTDVTATLPANTTSKNVNIPALAVLPGTSLYVLWADDNGPGVASNTTGGAVEGVYTLDNVNFTPTLLNVPEPATMGLAGVAALGLLARRRRK